jgi:hypothetical protein
MHALFTELDVPEDAPTDLARKALNEIAVPMARQSGAVAAYWLGQRDGRGVAIVIFDDEAAATGMASHLTVGASPPGAPAGVTFRTVEVREVLASL